LLKINWALTVLAVTGVILTSIFTSKTFSSVWLIVNQFQIYFFLILTQASLPTDVKDFIKGNTYLIFNFSFLRDNTISNDISEALHEDQSKYEMKEVGLVSESTLNITYLDY